MGKEGFIKLHRQIMEWEWYSDTIVKVVFLHLLLGANHKDNKWRGVDIKKGQILTGRLKLAQELNLSEMQIRTALKKLKSTNEITIKSTSQYSIITINNWDNYQDNNQRSNQPITNEQPTNNQPITTNKNDKNDKNDKNIISISGKTKKIDPYSNEYITHYEKCYKKIIGTNNCFLLQMHRDKINELAETLKDKYFESVETVLKRLKKLNFQSIGFKPNTTWLLKDDNYIKLLEGSFETETDTKSSNPYSYAD